MIGRRSLATQRRRPAAGFGGRTRLYPNVVYSAPGNYTLRVPMTTGRHRRKLGMTAMDGEHGVLKADLTSKFYTHTASSVRIDQPQHIHTCVLTPAYSHLRTHTCVCAAGAHRRAGVT